MCQFNQKMKVSKESGFSQKKTISTNIHRQKLDDLGFLRNQPHPGPFTISEAVTFFREN